MTEYLWIVMVTEDVQSTISRDPEHLLASPALLRGLWDKQNSGGLHALQQHKPSNVYIKQGIIILTDCNQ